MTRRSLLSVVACVGLAAGGCMNDGDERQMQGGSDGERRAAARMSGERMGKDKVEQMTANWPAPSRKALAEMTSKYGQPNEVTPTHAVWWNNGPWKYTKVSSMPVDHYFPVRHPDLLEQAVDYRVPPEMFDDLARYDGSVIVERTKGEISARCHEEGANILALNLANEIVTGKRTVEDARAEYARQAKAKMSGQPAPLMERLMFSPMKGNSADPDQPAGQ
jgi:hypothetical protein